MDSFCSHYALIIDIAVRDSNVKCSTVLFAIPQWEEEQPSQKVLCVSGSREERKKKKRIHPFNHDLIMLPVYADGNDNI